MKQMVCSVCTYTYDEAKGIPEAGIAPGTKWEDLPEDWKCPWCGAGKEAFREKQETPAPPAVAPAEKPAVEQELSPMELSVICSNLARGCEKQYMPQEEAAFRKLADFFRFQHRRAMDRFSRPQGSPEIGCDIVLCPACDDRIAEHLIDDLQHSPGGFVVSP